MKKIIYSDHFISRGSKFESKICKENTNSKGESIDVYKWIGNTRRIKQEMWGVGVNKIFVGMRIKLIIYLFI